MTQTSDRATTSTGPADAARAAALARPRRARRQRPPAAPAGWLPRSALLGSYYVHSAYVRWRIRKMGRLADATGLAAL